MTSVGGPAQSDDIEAALWEALDREPDAMVCAIDIDGLFTAIPSSLPVEGRRTASTRSALDLVQPTDRLAVVEAWRRVREERTARLDVTLAGTGQRATLLLFDVTASHGVFVGLVVSLDGSTDTLDEVAALPPPTPRLTRTRKDGGGVLTSVDESFTAMLGWTVEEAVGQRSLEFIHPDDQERAVVLWMEGLSTPGSTCRARLRHKHRAGHWVWLEISNCNLLDDPMRACVDSEMFDISEEMDAQESLRASEQLIRRLAGALPVGVVHFDAEGRIVYGNERLYAIFGAAGVVDGEGLLARVDEPETVADALEAVLRGDDREVELHIDRLDGGGRRRCTLTLRTLTNDQGAVTGGVGCLADVTDAVRMRTELERRATFDALTGCVNRAAVLGTLSSLLSLPAQPGPSGSGDGIAVIFVDLDEFKAVNDGFGHTVGDELLVALAARLRDVVRGADVVGRLGGDEFLLVCPNVDNAAVATAVAQRVVRAIAAPLTIGSIDLVPSASVGVAWAAHRSGIDAGTLVAEADAAMYTAKHARNGQPIVAESRQGHPANVA